MARAGKKKIDTLQLEHEGVKAEAPVYLHKGDRTITFSASVNGYDISASGTDLDKVRQELEQEFRRRVSVDWKAFLLVQFGGKTHDLVHSDGLLSQESRSQLKLQIERIWIGTDSAGEKMYCDNHDHHHDYKSSIRHGMPDVGPMDSDWWSKTDKKYADGVAAVIADTPENRMSVQRIIDGMNQLLEKLRGLLSPEQIEKTIALVSKNMLMLGPKPEPEVKKK